MFKSDILDINSIHIKNDQKFALFKALGVLII